MFFFYSEKIISFSPTATLSQWVIFSCTCLFLVASSVTPYLPHPPTLSFFFRSALPTCRSAESVGLATWAEEPAAAGSSRLPPAKGRDWKRVLPLTGKTCRKVYFQNQKVKVIVPYDRAYNINTQFICAFLESCQIFVPVSLPFLHYIFSEKNPVVTPCLRSGWLYFPRLAKKVRTTMDWVRAAATSSSNPSQTAWSTHNVLPRRYWCKHWPISHKPSLSLCIWKDWQVCACTL